MNDSFLQNCKNQKWDRFQSSFVVFFIFIFPQSFYSIIPSSLNSFFYVFMCFCYTILFLSNIKLLINKIEPLPLVITIIIIILGSINMLAHRKISYFNVVAPIFTYIGYKYIINNKINIKWFFYFFIISYIYYYIVYFSQLPDLFFRPGFDEDAAVFDNSSSNAIPISLNITLFYFFIFNYLYKENYQKEIFIISIINFGFIIIQQSRGGLLVSLLLVLISLFDYNKKIFFSSFFFLLIASFLFFTFNITQIADYIEVLGDINGIDALNQDVRGMAQSEFFNKLSFFNIFFGYAPNTTYVVRAGEEINYTYNVFLDFWNKYTIFGFILMIILIVNRAVFYKNYFFPVYYFLPFLTYCMIESLFFPNFWDAIIFLLFFVKKGFPYFKSYE